MQKAHDITSTFVHFIFIIMYYLLQRNEELLRYRIKFTKEAKYSKRKLVTWVKDSFGEGHIGPR